MDNSCRSRDSNPQPRVTSPTLYPLGHGCPKWPTNREKFCSTRKTIRGNIVCDPKKYGSHIFYQTEQTNNTKEISVTHVRLTKWIMYKQCFWLNTHRKIFSLSMHREDSKIYRCPAVFLFKFRQLGRSKSNKTQTNRFHDSVKLCKIK